MIKTKRKNKKKLPHPLPDKISKVEIWPICERKIQELPLAVT